MKKEIVSFLVLLFVFLDCGTTFAANKEQRKAAAQAYWRRYAAQSKLNQIRATSPYRKYAKTYQNLYKTGQMSQKEYTDKMLQLETLETGYQQNIDNQLVSAAIANRQSNQMQELADSHQASQSQNLMINPRRRVTDQYGNTVAYIDEN